MAASTETIPLFPLDVVLFPGMVLPLHIFEPRYRKMVRDCLTRGEPFGMIWAEQEPVVLSPDQPLIGTKAMMTEVVPMPDGRYNISTVGSERFRVRHLDYREPYLVGHIEPYPSTHVQSPHVRRALPALRRLFRRYLDLLSESTQQDVALDALPDDPVTLAFIVAILYQGQNWRKQQLLSTQSLPELLQREVEWLRLENALVQQALQQWQRGTLAPLINGSLAVYGLN